MAIEIPILWNNGSSFGGSGDGSSSGSPAGEGSGGGSGGDLPSDSGPNNGEPSIPGEGGGNPPVPNSEVGGIPNTEPNSPNFGDNTTPLGATNQSGNVGGNGYGNANSVPNPNGKNGGEPHQSIIHSLQPSNSNGTINYEYKYDTFGGYKNTRYADAVEVVDGEVVCIHQVGKLNQNGTPVIRESRAIDDIMSSPD